ncbi:amino acid transporter [Microbacterium foliorum]|uniref:Amino acid transporter n=1 Tax=Microbacterium foliorum TaxID=104336 RepID=A0ABU1HVL4_9MICO|nr:APC family permease [Microbacterium foliorum]MDR6144076.1 amino acid transporter [Microbacterium foliorum]
MSDTEIGRAVLPSSASVPGLRRGTLGAGRVAFFVVATVAPLAGLAGASPVVFGAVGAGAPVVFLLAGALFVIFSVGYVIMSRHLSNAGGYIAYIARAFGARAAAGAGYISVLAFFCVQLALWSQLAVFAQILVEQLTGAVIPAAVFLFGLLLVGTVVVCLGTESSIAVAGGILGLEMLALLALIVFGVVHGAADGTLATSIDLRALVQPGLGIAFLFAVSAFIGFEATVVFSEEAADPHRTIPRAVGIAIATIALSYALGTWAVLLALGPQGIQQAAADDPSGLVLRAAGVVAGPWLVTASTILIVTSFIASLIGSLNMFARVVFAMGRAGVLPRWVGRASRTGAPSRAAAAIGVGVAGVLLMFLLAGADLIGVVFSWFLALGTAALLVLLVATSVSIIVFFAKNPDLELGVWRVFVLPSIAAIGFTITAVLAVVNYDMLLGGSGDVARWLLMLIPLCAVTGWTVASRARVSPDFAADLS